MSKLRIAFDIGGVLSAHPELRTLFDVCQASDAVEVFIVTDMPNDAALAMLQQNAIRIAPERVLSADYAKHGGACKAVVCENHKIAVMLDDAINYACTGSFLRLLVMPMVERPYYSDDWKVPSESGNFGRARFHGANR